MRKKTARLLESLRRRGGPAHGLSDRLVDCASCYADLANAVAWHEVDESHWWIRLRCGACGFVREVEATDEEANRLDADLDRGLSEIAAAVARLDHLEMVAASDALVAALERDLIGPDDFQR